MSRPGGRGTASPSSRPPRGQIAYQIRVQGGGTYPYDGHIAVFDTSGALVRRLEFNGSDTIDGLRASTDGYTVCVDPAGTWRSDLAPKCYKNKAWSGDAAELPADAEPVVVTAGQTTATLVFALTVAGS